VEQRIKKFSIAPPTPNLKPTGKCYDAKNAAKYLWMSLNTLYSRCKEKLIVFYEDGNIFKFNEVDLKDYMQRCKRNAA
jgi:hypothetical protein